LGAEIKLGVTPNGIPKVDFAIALNRVLTHIRIPLTTMTKLLLRYPPWGSTGMGRK